MSKSEFVSGRDYPPFMTENSLKMLRGGYLLDGETPNDAIKRVGDAVGEILERKSNGIISSKTMSEKVIHNVKNGNFGFSSPIWANMGTKRGLPISCFGTHVGDNMQSIGRSFSEITIMGSQGGGTSGYLSDVRPEGSSIRDVGVADGVMMPIGFYEKITQDIRQGEIRKGAFAGYLDLSHGDFYKFMSIRGKHSEFQQITFGVCVSDEEIEKIKAGDGELQKRWALLLKVRAERGMPFIIFTGNANKHKPEWYKKLKYQIRASNLCTEIMLPADEFNSFVCCLLPLNLQRFEQWDADTVQIAVFVLDAVMEDFIEKTEGMYGMERARKFAIEHRALGLGTMGWHTFLQDRNIPFIGLLADSYTRKIFSTIKEKAEKASLRLGRVLGECKVCEGTGRRNTTLLAPAPNVSSANIFGELSATIEPILSNHHVDIKAKGTFTYKNSNFKKILVKKGKDTREVWMEILKAGGSVQQLDFLSEDEKEVFKTFGEINQMEIVKQAAIRQKYIDQSQSLNLSFPPNTDPREINKVILKAHELGLKSLYYQRSYTLLRENMDITSDDGCLSCDG